jgi:antitoxin component of MazEF toxin-antitoxin module
LTDFHGNSLALVIDRAVLDLLKISNDTPLDISTDGQVLEARQRKFRQALEAANQKYGRALRRLAE